MKNPDKGSAYSLSVPTFILITSAVLISPMLDHNGQPYWTIAV